MSDLPLPEKILFIIAIILYLAAAIVGFLQVSRVDKKHQSILTHFISLAVALEAILLIFRAASLRVFPLTGLFESMIALTLIFGIIYLILGIFIRQIWFGSVMAWMLCGMILLTAFFAQPAIQPHQIATEPWAVVHALAMVLGAALILLSVVSSYVYLIGSRRLKNKQVTKVFGIIPNIQKLEKISILALKWAFIFLTLGGGSGVIGVWLKAEILHENPWIWLFDSKILGLMIAWLTLGCILTGYRLRLIRGQRIAYACIFAFIWILFAFVGASILCNTKHKFSYQDYPPKQINQN